MVSDKDLGPVADIMEQCQKLPVESLNILIDSLVTIREAASGDETLDPPVEKKPVSFQEQLEHLINSHSMENRSNTPDFILAEYMKTCLRAFEAASIARDQWYGIKPEPGWDGKKVGEEG